MAEISVYFDDHTQTQLRLPRGAMVLLDRLADEGVIGTTRSEVAAYLVMRALDDIERVHSTAARRGEREG